MVAENKNVNQDVKSAILLLTLQNTQLAWMDLLCIQQLKNAWNVMTSVWLAIQIISKTAHHVILGERYLELTLEDLHVQNAKLIIVGNAVQLVVAKVVKISTFCIWMIHVSLVWVIADFVQNLSMCSECFSGYFLTEVDSAQTCVLCASGCSQCTSLTDCVNCYPGYFLNINTNTWDKCSQNCWNCNSSTNCTRCVMGY